MLEITNILDKPEFITEYFKICIKEWGTHRTKNDINTKAQQKAQDFLGGQNKKIITILILTFNKKLIGFVSLFQTDSQEKPNLSPWYATMYVKPKFRHQGYSKLLNKAILKKAQELGYNKVYLKTNLINYYEKFGFKFIEELETKEKLYYIEIKKD